MGKKIIFVLDAVVGDLVKIEVIKEKKNYSVARIKNFIKKSELRCDNFCKYQNICGGCNVGNMSYDAQVVYKETKITNIVARYLKEDIKINPIIYSKNFIIPTYHCYTIFKLCCTIINTRNYFITIFTYISPFSIFLNTC